MVEDGHPNDLIEGITGETPDIVLDLVTKKMNDFYFPTQKREKMVSSKSSA